MRGCLVIGLGLLFGLTAAWTADSAATAPAPSCQPAPSASSGQAPNGASSGPNTQPAAGAAEIDRLIDQLGSEKFAEREAAQQALVKNGATAVPRLRAALQDKDSERVERAKGALDQIRKNALHFAVYLVTGPADALTVQSAALDELSLEPEPILGDADIVGYDWDSHTLHPTPEARKRLLRLAEGTQTGSAFVVACAGRRCYAGIFRWNHHKGLPGVPLVYVDPAQGARVGPNAIRIEPPPATDAKDPRSDERIRQSLQAGGMLRRPRPPAGVEPEAPWGEPVNGLSCRLALLTPTTQPHRGEWLREKVQVLYELRNVSDKPVRLWPFFWPIVSQSPTSSIVFRVIGPDGKPAKHIGVCANPVPPRPWDFVTIAPKQVLIQQVGLPYEFILPGAYQISTASIEAKKDAFRWYYGDDAEKAAKNHDNVWTGKLESFVVVLKVAPPATAPVPRAPAAAGGAK